MKSEIKTIDEILKDELMPKPGDVIVAPKIAEDVLSREQRARIECLNAARNALVNRSIGSSGKADTVELIAVARYIEGGVTKR